MLTATHINFKITLGVKKYPVDDVGIKSLSRI
jgi:hypothetical protein